MSTSAAITKQPFYIFSLPLGCKQLYKHTRLLPIPSAIDDYNHYIDRVDIADQLQAGFSTQQRRVKPWRPLFYWLLDSTIINAFQLSEHQWKSKLGSSQKDKVCSVHQAFYKALVLELLQDPAPKALKHSYTTKSTLLPNIQLTRPIGIHQQVPGKRGTCLFCRWSCITKKGCTTKIITKTANLAKTSWICSHCGINLCTECFNVFHYCIE
jgi:hypothetical protein